MERFRLCWINSLTFPTSSPVRSLGRPEWPWTVVTSSIAVLYCPIVFKVVAQSWNLLLKWAFSYSNWCAKVSASSWSLSCGNAWHSPSIMSGKVRVIGKFIKHTIKVCLGPVFFGCVLHQLKCTKLTFVFFFKQLSFRISHLVCWQNVDLYKKMSQTFLRSQNLLCKLKRLNACLVHTWRIVLSDKKMPY